MINIQTERKRRSEKLTKDEHKALMHFVKGFHTLVDAAGTIGIHRNVLDLVMIKGSGSPATIEAIRKAINSSNTNVVAKTA